MWPFPTHKKPAIVKIAGFKMVHPGSRTPNLLIRSQTLYPVELWVPEGTQKKVAVLSAETDAGQLFGSRYAKGGGPNIDLFLAAYTGDPAPSHRVGKDVPLLHPARALVLCVQPQAVAEVIIDKVARGRALVDRMAFIYPPSRMGKRKINPEPVPPSLLA